jgi:hypothetical protein
MVKLIEKIEMPDKMKGRNVEKSTQIRNEHMPAKEL